MMEPKKIYIGEIFTSSEPAVIETILGSCVSVCLHDPRRRIGGMNHILLPGRADKENFDGATRYGINAMEVLINSMMKLGARRKDLLSKVFGGAHVLLSIGRHLAPGSRNIQVVEEFLSREGIPIVSRSTGGYYGRKIQFHTHSGDVYLKTLPNPKLEAVTREEGLYSELVQYLLDKPGEATLFPTDGDGEDPAS